MRFRVDDGVKVGAELAGRIDIIHPAMIERVKHCALVPVLVKKPDSNEWDLDHFDLIPRTSVDTTAHEELGET